MSNPWIVMPLVIPALTAAFLVLALRHTLPGQRIVSVGAAAAQLAIAIGLFIAAEDGATRAYLLGNWPVPYGIILVLDRLAATMLLLSGILGLTVVVASLGAWDQRGRHFHALFQFQLLGINGAFLTGDLFNLFVFFEVLLIASYGLMLHGGGTARLKAGFHYVAINLIGSTVFLFAVGIIYAVVGTLNMADLAAKVPQVSSENVGLLATGALLLLTVFAIKSAMVPLHWWLPSTYGSTSPPAAALFAIMTKVGAYSIIRVYTLIFGAEAGPLAGIAAPWLIPAGLLTLVLGTIAVLAARSMLDLICYALVASMGTLLIAIGLQSEAGLAAALYYAVQSTLVFSGLFLLAGLLARDSQGGVTAARLNLNGNVLACCYLLLAIGMVGLPPLAGFIGKLQILEAARTDAQTGTQLAIIWTAILGTSLLLLVGFVRIGIRVFWTGPQGEMPMPRTVPKRTFQAMAVLIAAVAALSILAGPVMDSMNATAQQVMAPKNYIGSVFEGSTLKSSVEPQTPTPPAGD